MAPSRLSRWLAVMALGALAAAMLMMRRRGDDGSPGDSNWSPVSRPNPDLRDARSMR